MSRYTLGCHAPCGPEVNLPQMKAVAHRLVIPQLVRVIAMDAVSSRDSTGCETDDYWLFGNEGGVGDLPGGIRIH